MKDKVIVFKLKNLYKDDPVDRLRGVNIVNTLQKNGWNVSLYNNQKNIDIIVYIGDDLYDKIIYQHINAKYIIQDLQDDPFKNLAGNYMQGKEKNSFYKKVMDRFSSNNFKYASYQLLLKLFWKITYKEYIKSVDYIITSSLGLQSSVQEFNKNVIMIPDAIETSKNKTDYKSEKIKICWVGTVNNIAYLHLVNEVLLKLQQKFGIEIIIISSKEIYNDKQLSKQLSDLLFKFTFIEWNITDVNENIQACDIAIAPLPNGVAKSSNKVLSYMSLGVPTVCSGSKDYKLLAQEKSNSLVYLEDNSNNKWYDALVRLIESDKERELVGQAGYHSSLNYTLDSIVEKYEELFKSL